MHKRAIQYTTVCILLGITLPTFAEGIIDIKPSISTSINHDDNVFRFSSPEQARATFGSAQTADTVKRLDLGATINLRLSRQLLVASAHVTESRYNRFDLLDNTAKSLSLGWNWRLGNDVYGELIASKREAISGFNDIRTPVKNLRTNSNLLARINWDIHPDWTVYAAREKNKIDNEQANFSGLNREDESIETGLLFQDKSNTQLGLAYRQTTARYPSRLGFQAFLFGSEDKQKSILFTAAWQPTSKTVVSTRLSQINIDYNTDVRDEFSGFNQRWNISHALTGKMNLNASVYKEVSPIDDILSTYVQATGVSINPSWRLSGKTSLLAGLSVEKRDFLGSANFFINNGDDRSDTSKIANLSLFYAPTNRSLVQLQYLGEIRSSSIDNQDYEFNNLNLSFKYDF